jgi:hypothetical protein
MEHHADRGYNGIQVSNAANFWVKEVSGHMPLPGRGVPPGWCGSRRLVHTLVTRRRSPVAGWKSFERLEQME